MLVRNAADAEQEPGAPLLFLSHAGDESEAARALAVTLRDAGVEVWLDVERLKPGDRWQHEIGAALQRSNALILYVGRSGVARWVDFEVQIALDRAAKEGGFRLIPVLGPGADSAALPDFIKLFQWLDLRGDAYPTPEKLKSLLAGILNQPAEQIAVLPPDRPPFRGLLHFDIEDAIVFFGREQETEELLRLLGKDPFLLVVGDSGCGKSSLVRAGLVPALLRGRLHDGRAWVSHWRVAITRPGNDPFGELAESLPDLASEVSARPERIHANRRLLAEGADGLRDIIAGSVAPNSRTLLVVDQFEELFTLTPDATVRRRYIDCLLRAANAEGSRPVHVVITLRADFFGRCWESPDLLDRVRKNQYLTPRLPIERLRELIERPLAMAGAEAEPGLIETMLDDIGDEPGNLALLEHALDQLWQKRRGNGEGLRITHEAYESLGRLAGALRTHANAAMERLKDDEERALARRFFVDLTQLGEGTEDTRRRVRIEELTAAAGDQEKAIKVLEKLASERLITTGDNHAEVAHEELIRNWPELRRWVDADREFLRRERKFLEDAKEWQRLGRDQETLLRGARLVEAEAWLASSRWEVPNLARELIETSAAERKREEGERENRRQAELLRLRRTRRVATTAAAIFILLTIGLSYFGRLSLEASRLALARGLAAQAQLIEIKDPEMIETRARLAAESMRRQRLPENERSVRDALEALGKPIAQMLHGESVISVVFSPDGQRVASGSWDTTARVWEAETGKEIARIKHSNKVTSVAFSPDGKRVVSGSEDKTARVWEAATGKEIARIKHGGPVSSVAFSPDGQRVVSGSEDKTARVWEVAMGKEIAWIKHDAPVSSVAFSPDGQRVVSGSWDRTARVWEATTGKEIARGKHNALVVSVAFSRDGQKVVSGSDDGTALVWEVATGKEIVRVEHRAPVTSVASSPDGERIVSGSRDADLFKDSGELLGAIGNTIARFKLDSAVNALAFSPDNQKIISASEDGTARLWEAETGKEIARVQHGESVISVAFSPNGKRVASGSTDGDVRVWEIAPREMDEWLPSNPVVVFSQSLDLLSSALHDRNRAVSDIADNTVRIWEATTGKEIARIQQSGIVNSVALSPDRKHVVIGKDDGTALVWDIARRRGISQIQHDSSINSVAFSPDGKRVVSSSSDGLLLIWDPVTGKEVARIEHEFSGAAVVALSPNSKQVVSGDDFFGVVQVWNLANGKEIARFKHEGSVQSVTFSPDGRQIASGSGRSLIFMGDPYEARVWDTTTKNEIARIEYTEPVHAVAFSPDGRWLTTVTGGSVSFHPVKSKDLLEQVCSRLWRNFTQEEWQRYLPGEPYRKTCPNLPAGK